MLLYQDYKEFFEREFELEYHDIHIVREQINELIAAYEQAQAELAEEKKECEQYAWEYAASEKDSIDLRTQLDETNDLYEIAEEGRTHFMEQLAEAQTLSEEWRKSFADADKAYNKSQAEVERLQTIVDGYGSFTGRCPVCDGQLLADPFAKVLEG